MRANKVFQLRSETNGQGRTELVRLLVVGDDAGLLDLLTSVLRSAGYHVHTGDSGANAAAAAGEWAPALIVQDGFTVTRHRRGRRHTAPAIFLTPGGQLRGTLPSLTLGGGSYLSKPFSPDELIASIRAVLRRTHAGGSGPGDGCVMRFADLELQEDAHDVRRDGEPIRLTPTEFKLLRYLMRNVEKVLTKTQILEHVWPYGYAGGEQVVCTYILKLRGKIDRVDPRLIHTVRGVGYILRLPHHRRTV